MSGFAESVRRDDRPLIMPIDRWGHTPTRRPRWPATPVAIIVRAHLAGQEPAHTWPSMRPRPTPARPDPTPSLVAMSGVRYCQYRYGGVQDQSLADAAE